MTETTKPAVSLVMPCYNEQECLRTTSMALLEAFARENIALQLVLVDNGSRDRTGEVIDAMVAEGFPVTKVVVPVNQGYGHGVLEGLKGCTAPWVGYLCADGQVPPEGAVAAYRRACAAKEPVLAKVRRKFRRDSWRRKLISICYNLGMPLIFGWLGTIDLNASPKIMARETYLMMNPQSKDWFLDPEIMIRAKHLGLRVVEDNVEGQLRQGGKSNVRFRTILEFAKNIVRYRRGGPISKWRASIRARNERDEAAASTPGGVPMKPTPTPAVASTELMIRRTSCRACGGTRLTPFLSLGEVPLANAFLTADQLGQPELRFPLEVFFCEGCSLVQLVHVVNPEVLFSNYLYRTGTNQTIARHNAGLAQAVVEKLGLTAKDLVVEVASNDGSLLDCFRQRGTRTLGVEPAKNIARLASEAGIETLNEFFNAECAAKIASRYGRAAAVIANNVLAHVDATVEFLSACRDTLRPEGRIVIEVPYLVEMLERLEYDTIYHEHLCYFSVTALMRLFAEAGLVIEHIDRVEIHGGSLRIWATRADHGEHGDAVLQMAARERAAGLDRVDTYREFARRTEDNRQKLLALLGRLKSEGKKIVGYGAPAKGNTLLCYCGIGTDLLPHTVDRSPLKVGLYTPGSHIPVVPFDRILEDQPDYVLLLAWNFAPEIMESLKPFAAKGGQFILPIPEPRILERGTSIG